MAHLANVLRSGRFFGLCALLAALALPAAAYAQADDDDEGPTAKPADTTPAPSSERRPLSRPSETAPADQGTGSSSSSDSSENARAKAAKPAIAADQGYLEGRAEVESPNEAIHTVQKKNYTAADRLELTVYPGAIQLNSKFTNSDGVALAIDYALQENFALQILGLYNYVGSWAPLTGQLFDNKARPQAADQLILQGGILGGFEVAPIYGKFAFYDGTLAQFRFVLNAGAGVGFTQVQLSGSTDKFPTNQTTYGSTGLRFLGNLGVGFRILLGERFALRLEVRDLLYTARVDSINGCSANDLANIATASASCDTSDFNTVPNNVNLSQQHTSALTVATKLLGDNSSDVVNDIIFLAGLSFLF